MNAERVETSEFLIPLKVNPMRVRRTYSGGLGIDLWHDQRGCFGNSRPEEWLASVTKAINPGFPEETGEGLSRVFWNGKTVLLKELIELYPRQMLGERHLREVGNTLGILAKMIDSAERLSIQVHPDKAFSRKWFYSEYGKTECWYILAASEAGGEQPYLLIGFRPEVTQARWRQLYERQDIEGMIGCMHKITPRKGEVWLIKGGLPHAIGPGCFLLELQEPTDYTMRTEKTRSDGSLLPELLIHQGAGDEGLLQCFHYDNVTEEQLRQKCCILPQTKKLSDAGEWTKLVGKEQTPCFSMAAAVVNTALHFPAAEGFAIAVVLRGSGSVETATGSLKTAQGDQMFFPSDMREFTLRAQAGQTFEVLLCYPPKAELHEPSAG